MIRKKYKTIIFDCDGVILDSNRVKTNAFFNITKTHHENAAKELVDFHKENGGISRYIKLNMFLKEILPKYIQDTKEISLESLLELYAQNVKEGLLNCKVAEGLFKLNKDYNDLKWAIVSGGDQSELRYIFRERNLDTYFDAGIFGSPDDKETIIKREFQNKNFIKPAIFIGDSKYDYIAAKNCGIDFVFLSKWTEFVNWEIFIKEKNIFSINEILELEKIL